MRIAPTIRFGGSRIRVSPREDRTYNGRVYHSKAEATQAAELDLMVQRGEILSWEPQVPMVISINGIEICKVVLDFLVKERSFKGYYIEVKGHETEVWKLKKKMLLAQYPNIDLRVVKA